MMKFLLITGFVLGINFVFSQEIVDYNVVDKSNLSPAKPGTFQLIILNPKVNSVFTDEILYFVEKHRKENEDVTILMTPYVELYIPSREKINSKGFKPLTDIIK